MTEKKSPETSPSAAKPRSPRKKSPQPSATKPTRRSAQPVSKAAKPSAARRKPAAKPAAKTARREPTREEIATRAREIWRERGGTALENWLQAERELKR